MVSSKVIITLRFPFLVVFVSSITILQAHIVHYDDHWKERREAALKAANQAYNPNPHNVTHQFNRQVHQNWNSSAINYANATKAKGGSRRLLRHHNGPCLATNPIDQCWRCDPNWAKNRKRLASCAMGFGQKTTGGAEGEFYVVNDDSDDDMVNPKVGTLRHAVIQTEPLWIIFDHPMLIHLNQELIVTSDKTIDGRGHHIHLTGGAGFMLQFVQNVIIHGLHIHDINPENGGMIRDSLQHYGLRGRSDGDGISLFGATNVWIDHMSMSNCADGLIDAVEMSTAITISNSHFTNHNHVMLFGENEMQAREHKIQQITLAFNHFGRRLVQRIPRGRYGFYHIVNNDYTMWENFAIAGSFNPTMISQGNRFVASPNPFTKEVTKHDGPESEWKDWLWTSQGDLFEHGAFFRTSGIGHKMPALSHDDMITAKPGTFAAQMTQFSGALKCIIGQPC